MKKVSTTLIASPPTGMGAVDKAWDAVSVSFDRFCLTAGIEAPVSDRLVTVRENVQNFEPGRWWHKRRLYGCG
jgi:hypothetical protein